MNVEDVCAIIGVCFQVGGLAYKTASYVFNLRAENQALKTEIKKFRKKRKRPRKVLKLA